MLTRLNPLPCPKAELDLTQVNLQTFTTIKPDGNSEKKKKKSAANNTVREEAEKIAMSKNREAKHNILLKTHGKKLLCIIM